MAKQKSKKQVGLLLSKNSPLSKSQQKTLKNELRTKKVTIKKKKS